MSQFDELVEIMSRLRSPGGCPWDREQTHRTLKPYLIEEAYEVLDAVDGGDDRDLREELGDVLLQIVFHAQIASETGRFDIDDVVAAISGKLIRRHPHVFGDSTVESSDHVAQNWEAIKSDEREEKGRDPSILDGIPSHLPSLLRARQVQKRAARVGFEWEHPQEAVEKAREEVEEFLQARSEADPDRLAEELGDVLFALVNVARYYGICSEDALRKTIDKFHVRFRFIESELRKQGREPLTATPEEMDQLWEEAKGLDPQQGDPS